MSAFQGRRLLPRLPLLSLQAATISLVAALAITDARADQNWDGDNPFGNFSYNNNWYGNSQNQDVQPTWGFNSGSLYFNFRNNSSQTSLFTDYGSWRDTNDIIYASTFGAGLTWSSDGNGINFNQRLENRSSYTQVINLPLSGAKNGASQIELNPVNGNLTISGTIYNENSKPYYVYGNNGKTLSLGTTLGVGSSASAVSLNVEQNSVVSITSEQNFTGGATINAGQIRANASSNSIGTGAVVVNSSGTLGGSGSANNSLITVNGTITAGADDATVGSLTTGAEKYNGGGKFLVKMRDSNGSAGSGWDSIAMSSLDVSGLSSSNKFTIMLNSYSGSNGSLTNGAISGFVPTASKTWTVATLSNGLPATAAALQSLFTLDYTNFLGNNSVPTGSTFSLRFSGGGDGLGGSGAGTIAVVYNAAPEPTTTLLFGGTASALLASRRRRIVAEPLLA